MNPTAFPAAFPVYGLTCDQHGHLTKVETYQPGMTLRDYFAGQIIQGIFSDRENLKTARILSGHDARLWDSGLPSAYLANLAYEMADRMLARRGKL